MDATVWGAIVSAAAAVALAFFGGVQLYREAQRNKRARLSAIAQMSAEGFLLREQLRRWVGPAKSDEFQAFVEERAPWAQGAAAVSRELGEAVNRASRLVGALAEVDDRRAKSARRTLVLVMEGVRRANEFRSTSRPHGSEFFDWVDLRTQGEQDCRDAIAALEDGVIEPFLLNEQGILRRTREEDSMRGTLKKAAQLIADDLERAESQQREQEAKQLEAGEPGAE